jgi:DNA-binding MarR family transcriptional regulator/GNAT superfamily N-acetyltransferase
MAAMVTSNLNHPAASPLSQAVQAPQTASATPPPPATAHVNAVRGFNRFYTQRIGVLDPYLGSELSLTEVRVLYELAHRDQPAAAELGRDLALDAGYLSRILKRFEARGWLARVPSIADARQNLLQLTNAGQAVFAPLQQKSSEEAAALLAALPSSAQQQLVSAMSTVQHLLAPPGAPPSPSPLRAALLREPAPGDMGWVIQQHGEIYAREYGWTAEFEAMVADIVAKFLKNFRLQDEKGWIAELDGERVGAVFVVRKSPTTAQLRMLILTPQARGLGLGGRLTDECIKFARSRGYKKMVLWTNSGLDAARAIYAKRGFILMKSEPYHGFGHDLVGENWALKL